MKEKLNRAFLRARNCTMQAFSLVELMVTLVVIAVVMSALVPSITKKLRTQGITVGGSIGGGSSSGGGGSSNYDPNLTMNCADTFGENCELCYTNACITCNLVCSEGEYKNVSSCTCVDCKGIYGDYCEDCNENKCLRCASGHGQTSGGGCTSLVCPDGQYSDNGASLCKTCEAGYYCIGGMKTPCELDEYSIAGQLSCTKCSTAVSGCDRCSSATNCTSCEAGYTLENNSCVYLMSEKEFTVAGEHSFVVPDNVTKIKVLAISGGAGGGGGGIVEKITDFLSAGTHTWEIPVVVRGADIKFSSVGGAGGKGWTGWPNSWAVQGTPEDGCSLKDISLQMPNSESIKIVVGSSPAQVSFSSGCNQQSAYNSGTGAWDPRTSGGRAGGATYFEGYYIEEYVACGGAGGSGNWYANQHVSNGCARTFGTTMGTNNNIFTTSNIGISRGHVGETGAMRIYWNDKIASTGGGTGHMAYNEEVAVIPGETLKIIVGRGGKGGEANNQGEWGTSEMLSKIIGSSGSVYVSSAVSPSTMGSSGGNSDSVVGSAGYITDGQTSTQITVDGLSGADGSATSDLAGGNGGQSVINGVMTHCTVGVGGNGLNVDGTSAIGYGGCGGGGAGAGAKGGDGATGYVKIELIRDE